MKDLLGFADMVALFKLSFITFTLKLLSDRGHTFDSLARNAFNPVLVCEGPQINVAPGEVPLGLDGRVLLHFNLEQLVSELRKITGSEAAIEIEVLNHDQEPQQTDMGLFDTLTSVLEESGP